MELEIMFEVVCPVKKQKIWNYVLENTKRPNGVTDKRLEKIKNTKSIIF